MLREQAIPAVIPAYREAEFTGKVIERIPVSSTPFNSCAGASMRLENARAFGYFHTSDQAFVLDIRESPR